MNTATRELDWTGFCNATYANPARYFPGDTGWPERYGHWDAPGGRGAGCKWLIHSYTSGSDYSGSLVNMEGPRADLIAVLASAPKEVLGLLLALREGRVDGSSYTGECACLVGTIANVRSCDYAEIPGLKPNAYRPAERWFLAIAKGHTPATSIVSAITVGWVEAWLAEQASP